MQTLSIHKKSGATAEKPKRVTRIEIPLSERAALTPREFAGVFGKAQTWAYRQIYAGRIHVVDALGTMMIPRSELERITRSAAVYKGGAK